MFKHVMKKKEETEGAQDFASVDLDLIAEASFIELAKRAAR